MTSFVCEVPWTQTESASRDSRAKRCKAMTAPLWRQPLQVGCTTRSEHLLVELPVHIPAVALPGMRSAVTTNHWLALTLLTSSTWACPLEPSLAPHSEALPPRVCPVPDAATRHLVKTPTSATSKTSTRPQLGADGWIGVPWSPHMSAGSALAALPAWVEDHRFPR
jgi:hypothetical protein